MLSGAFASASLATSQFAFRLIAMLAAGGTAWLIWRSARLRKVDPTRGLALFGLNPLVTLYGVGGGHSDMLMLMLSSGAVYAVLSRRDRVAGVLVSAGTAIKLTGGILLPFALLAEAGPRAVPRRRAFVLGFLLASAVIGVASLAVFGSGILHLPGTITSVQDHPTWKSGPGAVFAATGLRVPGVVRIVVDLILLGWVAHLLYKVWRGRMDWIEGAAWATVAVLITAWSFLPWYVAWMLPLVALCRSGRLWNVAMVLTLIAAVFMVAGTLPNGVTF
jgi:alpha-1,6-mannosyltransferase